MSSSTDRFRKFEAFHQLNQFIETERNEFYGPWLPISNAFNQIGCTDWNLITTTCKKDQLYCLVDRILNLAAVIGQNDATDCLSKSIESWSASDDRLCIAADVLRAAIKNDRPGLRQMIEEMGRHLTDDDLHVVIGHVRLSQQGLERELKAKRRPEYSMRMAGRIRSLGLSVDDVLSWYAMPGHHLTPTRSIYLEEMLDKDFTFPPVQSDQIVPRHHPKAVAQARKKGMTTEEANKKAGILSKRNGRHFWNMSIRRQAIAIGCSCPTWKKTALFETKARSQPQLPKTPRSRKAVGLHGGIGEASQVNKYIEAKRAEELEALIGEQKADTEPSPLDPQPIKVHARKSA